MLAGCSPDQVRARNTVNKFMKAVESGDNDAAWEIVPGDTEIAGHVVDSYEIVNVGVDDFEGLVSWINVRVKVNFLSRAETLIRRQYDFHVTGAGDQSIFIYPVGNLAQ